MKFNSGFASRIPDTYPPELDLKKTIIIYTESPTTVYHLNNIILYTYNN